MKLPINQIICGDNCDVLCTFPPECIDLVVTSPPYDDLRTYGGHSWDFYGVSWLLTRLLKPGGVIVWNVNDETKNGSETGTSLAQALHFKNIGLQLHDTMVYQKKGFSFPDVTRYHQTWEYMFVFSKGKPKTFNPICDRKNETGGKPLGGDYKRNPEGVSVCRPGSENRGNRSKFGQRFNVWQYSTGSGRSSVDTVSFNHPAIFPEKLAQDHILSWSNDGEIVLDPFNGSGTTTKMAREMGRKYIGIDVSQEYCEIAEKRIAQGLLF